MHTSTTTVISVDDQNASKKESVCRINARGRCGVATQAKTNSFFDLSISSILYATFSQNIAIEMDGYRAHHHLRQQTKFIITADPSVPSIGSLDQLPTRKNVADDTALHRMAQLKLARHGDSGFMGDDDQNGHDPIDLHHIVTDMTAFAPLHRPVDLIQPSHVFLDVDAIESVQLDGGNGDGMDAAIDPATARKVRLANSCTIQSTFRFNV
jgi:hypothetical protein